jgi:hypothetical protein
MRSKPNRTEREQAMSWLADAHRDWHTVHGQMVVCPLDCGVTEGLDDEWEAEAEKEAQQAFITRS